MVSDMYEGFCKDLLTDIKRVCGESKKCRGCKYHLEEVFPGECMFFDPPSEWNIDTILERYYRKEQENESPKN